MPPRDQTPADESSRSGQRMRRWTLHPMDPGCPGQWTSPPPTPVTGAEQNVPLVEEWGISYIRFQRLLGRREVPLARLSPLPRARTHRCEHAETSGLRLTYLTHLEGTLPRVAGLL